MYRLLYVLLFSLITSQLFAEETDSIDSDFAKAIKIDKETAEPKKESPEGILAPLLGGGSENPDISFIFDGGFAHYSSDNHIRQEGHSISENGFALQGVELAVSHSVDNYFSFDMNFQFVGMHIEEAYFTTLSLPLNLQARGGMMNAMFGRENSMHLHVVNFSNYSLLHNRFMSPVRAKNIASLPDVISLHLR